MRLRVLVAPSGFKESLGADEVADCIAAGVRRAVPDALIRKAPLADGARLAVEPHPAGTGGATASTRFSLRSPRPVWSAVAAATVQEMREAARAERRAHHSSRVHVAQADVPRAGQAAAG